MYRPKGMPLPLTSRLEELGGNDLLDIMDNGTKTRRKLGAQHIGKAHGDRLAREVVNLPDNLQTGHHWGTREAMRTRRPPERLGEQERAAEDK